MKKRAARRRLVLLLALCILFAVAWKVFSGMGDRGAGGSSATSSSGTKKTPAGAPSVESGLADANRTKKKADESSGVVTYHNGNTRIGVNSQETILTPKNVNAGEFGRLFTVQVDGDVYAQPLYLPKVDVPSLGVHNIVYVATENNTVYAIDADDPRGLVLWSAHLGSAVYFKDLPAGTCTVIVPVLGITGTPVIDALSKTMYLVTRTFENSKHEFRLHAIDISTGKERPSSPVVISASVQGKGDGSQNGKLLFEPTLQLQRPGLALDAGKVYIGFGSTCDFGNYHGWLLAYDVSTLAQTAAMVTTPNGSRGGIWQSGAAPGIDADGNVYVITGDGTFNATSGGSDYGDTFLKLSVPRGARWKVVDYFTPFDQERMDDLNDDLGSSGVVLLPDQPGPHPHLLVGAAKNGTLYLVDRDNMGYLRHENDSQIVQSIRQAQPKIDSTAAYWESTLSRWVYINGVGGPLQQYSLSDGKLSSRAVFQSEEKFGYPGSTPAISSNGKTNGIVWVVGTAVPDRRTVFQAYLHRFKVAFHSLIHEPGTFFRKLAIRAKLLFRSPSIFFGSLKKMLPRPTPEDLNRPAILRAYDAENVSNLLYDSTEAPQNRDQADLPVKFVVPTIANGKVYFGTQGHLDVYGLLSK